MVRPLTFKNVENITLQMISDGRAYFTLVPTFVCESNDHRNCIDVPNVIKICCSIFQLSAVTCAVVNGLTIITSEREVNGMVIENCTDILLQEIS